LVEVVVASFKILFQNLSGRTEKRFNEFWLQIFGQDTRMREELLCDVWFRIADFKI
jgi:hypothetical protein